MRKLLAALVISASLLTSGAFIIAAPVSAGTDEWTTSGCKSPYGTEIWWYNYSGSYGTRYWWNQPNAGVHDDWVGGAIMDIYTMWDWQCGLIGPPLNDSVWNSGFPYQEFTNGWIYWSADCWRVQLKSGHSPWMNGCWSYSSKFNWV